jgi:hypothetical protein
LGVKAVIFRERAVDAFFRRTVMKALFFQDGWAHGSMPASWTGAELRFMRWRMVLAVVLSLALLGGIAAPAPAAAIKPGPKSPAGAVVAVKVTNWREVDLVELEVTESGSTHWKKALGTLKAGQWTWARLPQGKSCHVDLHAKYADGQSADMSNVDICADDSVDLVN